MTPLKRYSTALRLDLPLYSVCFVGNGPAPTQAEMERWCEKHAAAAVKLPPGHPYFVDFDDERSQPSDSASHP